MGIDLRQEITSWLSEHGHWVVLRSASLNRRCSCIDPETGVSKDHCKRCMATGYLYVDYLVKAFTSTGLPDFETDTPVGDVSVGSAVYYLEHVVPIKTNDLMLELEIDGSTLEPVRPFKIRESFKIIQVEDERDEGGRVEFWQVRVIRMGVRPA